MFFITIFILTMHIVIVHDYSSMEQFRLSAKEYLGTDNFTVQSWDGFLVAKTSNGTQYPPESVVDEYFSNQLYDRLIFLGAALLIFACSYLVYYIKISSVGKQEKT